MKIRSLCSSALLMAASLVVAQQNQPCAGASSTGFVNWPRFRSDLCNTGYNANEFQLNVDTVPNLTQRWSYPNIYGTVSVANGVVYGVDDKSLYALNASTGALLWQYQTGGRPADIPAVANGVIYFEWNTNFPVTGNISALNLETGALLWTFTSHINGIYSSPAVVNGIVYFGSDDGNLYALNASTGALIWKYRTQNIVEAAPAVVDGVVYTTSADDNVYALDAKTGVLLWSFNTAGQMYSSPAVVNGVVYVGSGERSRVYALHASTGGLFWYYTASVFIFPSPAVANGVVYIGCEDQNLYALDAKTGNLLWKFFTKGPVESSPAVANGVVYFVSNDGYIYALNAASGALLWKFNSGGAGIDSSPVVANGMRTSPRTPPAPCTLSGSRDNDAPPRSASAERLEPHFAIQQNESRLFHLQE